MYCPRAVPWKEGFDLGEPAAAELPDFDRWKHNICYMWCAYIYIYIYIYTYRLYNIIQYFWILYCCMIYIYIYIHTYFFASHTQRCPTQTLWWDLPLSARQDDDIARMLLTTSCLKREQLGLPVNKYNTSPPKDTRNNCPKVFSPHLVCQRWLVVHSQS